MSGALQRSQNRDRLARDFGVILAAVLALVAGQTALAAGIDPLASFGGALLGQRLFVAVLYGALALAAVGAASVSVASTSADRSALDPLDTVRIALIAAALVAVYAYAVVDPEDPSTPVAGVLGPGLSAALMVAIGVAYARFCDVEIRTRTPTADDCAAVGAAAVVAVVAASTLAMAVGQPDPQFRVFLSGATGTERIATWTFVETAVLPSVLTAVGVGVLFLGAVHESLSTERTPAATAGSVAVLAVLPEWTSASLLAAFDGPLAALAVVAGVATVVAAAFAYGALWESVANETAFRASGTAAVAAAAVGGGCLIPVSVATYYAVTAGSAVPTVLGAIAYPVAVSASVVVYDRTRTVWAPIIALATSITAIQILVETGVLTSLV